MIARNFLVLLVVVAMPFAVVACGATEEPPADTMMEQPAADDSGEEAAPEEAAPEEMAPEEAAPEEAAAEGAGEEGAGEEMEEPPGAAEVVVMTIEEILASPQDGLMVNVSGTVTSVLPDGKLELADDTGTIVLELPEGVEAPAVGDTIGVFGAIDASGDEAEIDVVELMMLEPALDTDAAADEEAGESEGMGDSESEEQESEGGEGG